MFKRIIFLVASLALLCLNFGLQAHHGPADEDLGGASDIEGPVYSFQIDLVKLLGPPPAVGSAPAKAEIEEILKFQRERSPEEEAAIVADRKISVFCFADVLGRKFKKKNLPITAAFFEKIVDTSRDLVNQGKDIWKRPRPAECDSRIIPLGKEPQSASYPSGHATAASVMAIVLGDLVPEKRAELDSRGRLFALHRVMAGHHFRSDIEAGRIAGSALATQLRGDPNFIKDFKEAETELRSLLGYGD